MIIRSAFSSMTVPFNVNVDRLMLLTVKEEGESKESKYFWHISISFYSDSAKIGIIFDTNNFFAKKNCFWWFFVIFAPHTCRTDDDTLLSEERVQWKTCRWAKGTRTSRFHFPEVHLYGSNHKAQSVSTVWLLRRKIIDYKQLITINIDDFKNADQEFLEILTPSAFVEKYINVEPSNN